MTKNDLDYLDACIPEPMIILGLEMKPFSLGHLLILSRYKNGFVTEDTPITFNDLIFGVYVCAHTYEKAIASFTEPETGRKIERWGKKIGKFSFEEKANLFAEYLRCGMRQPDDVTVSEGEKTSLPLYAVIKYVVQNAFGYSASEILNLPYRQLLWEYYVTQEAKGVCKVSDPDVIKNAKEMADKFDALVRKK